jgi:hypothetical protein
MREVRGIITFNLPNERVSVCYNFPSERYNRSLSKKHPYIVFVDLYTPVILPSLSAESLGFQVQVDLYTPVILPSLSAESLGFQVQGRVPLGATSPKPNATGCKHGKVDNS